VRIGGAFRGGLRPAALRLAAALATASLCAASISACGNSADAPPASTPPDNIVKRSEVNGHPEGSVEKAFLEYWSSLQYQAWAEAVSYYAPSFRGAVGTAAIVGAKKVNAPSYPKLKPAIVEVVRKGGLTTIKYTLRLSDGTLERASVTWENAGGNWQIVFDSRLDAELNQFAENRVELAQNGVLPTSLDQVSPAARRAGAAASQRQSRFLQSFDLNSP
jgi:hypothetical protein